MQFRTNLVSSTRRICLAGAIAASAMFVSSAKAALTLTLSETGFAPSTLTDSGNTGQVTFNGSYGDFSTNIVVGSSNKLDPTPGPLAQLEIQTLDITKVGNAGSKTLTVTLTDDGYTFPGSTGTSDTLSSTVGGTISNGTAGDSVTFQSFAQPSGATPGLQTFTAVTPTGGSNQSFNLPIISTNFTRGATYTLSNVTTISLSNGNESTNVSGSTTVGAVPEPASAALLALLGTGLLGRARRSK